jgi:hypothetical protein
MSLARSDESCLTDQARRSRGPSVLFLSQGRERR